MNRRVVLQNLNGGLNLITRRQVKLVCDNDVASFSECGFISVLSLKSRCIETVKLEQLLALTAIKRCEANCTAQLCLLQLTPDSGDSNPIKNCGKSGIVGEHTDAVDKSKTV